MGSAGIWGAAQAASCSLETNAKWPEREAASGERCRRKSDPIGSRFGLGRGRNELAVGGTHKKSAGAGAAADFKEIGGYCPL